MDLLTRNGLRVAGGEYGRSRDITALLSHWLRTPEHDVINQRCVHVPATLERLKDLGGQSNR